MMEPEVPYQAKDVAPSGLLNAAYGNEVILVHDGSDSAIFQILKEFQLGDSIYAVLRSSMSKSDEYVLYRVTSDAAGDITLDSIDDDDEWETVAEIYDEMTFGI